jgi:cystathionine gamma-synthase
MVPTARPGTQCVHAGVQPDPAYGAVMPPIYQTSTFAFRDVCTNAGYDYTRSGNPTRAALEDAIAVLEGGAGATCTATGMSAVVVALNLLPHGSHLLCTVDCYGGTFRALEHAKATYGLEVTYLDLADLGAVEAAFRENTRMVWIETPSNPLLRLTDIRAVAAVARRRGALTVVDNTFLSPVLQRPFLHGADLVVHSTTKYLNGHSDVVGGAVVAAPGQTALAQRIQSMNNLLGTSQSPHDCFLVLRGLKTLLLRMRAHEAGAQVVARFLAGHPAVAKVHYPGLEAHPQHALARSQQDGFGAMLSFELADGRAERVDHVLRSLRWFTLAESLGGVESLVAHPASMTHASMTPEARRRAGITDSVIRLSIGIEEPKDLIADLAEALETLPA